ncbi:MAG: cytochrome b/b6 domain-containing protein [Yoonia sp.]|uniref:cytochrome b/b6 domain-containing protein n=1 Tax=Yoonia sp. TaxID=2212373 RepID=UPI00273FB9B4|nr:cytochrome b/b6 domain-containing protein [Yoonia sp.]MDP5086420.1 cytochrome b/b6 domain-containing protein [Yoonia sp.]
MAATTYGTVTKTFHWLTALLIITIIPLGVIANRLPYETNEQLAFKAQLFSFHKTLGVIVFAVALARIVWALTQPKPGSLHPERKAESFLAGLVHWLLYISLVAVPLTGWIHHAATAGFAPIWLPISQDLPLVPKDEGIAKLFAGLHWVWSKIMVASILLHIAGALKHHFIDKDQTLRRMWFGNHDAPDMGRHKGTLTAPVSAILVYALVTIAGATAGMYTPKAEAAQASLAAVASDWTVTEGEIALTVTQLGSPVAGVFEDWTSAITFDPEATGQMGDVTTTIAIGSLRLGSVTDDALGTNFFDAEAFPTATFTAGISKAEEGYLADGTLTIKDITMPLQLPFSLALDGDTAQMSGAVSIDRRDFQIGNNMSDESNLGFGVAVSITLTATRGTE